MYKSIWIHNSREVQEKGEDMVVVMEAVFLEKGSEGRGVGFGITD
jgi:hypothetical protein